MRSFDIGWKSASGIFGLVFTIIAILFLYVHDRLGFLRTIYPMQAILVGYKSSCSENAPHWMNDLLDHVIDEQFSLANQIAYIAPDGTLHHCENGWKENLLNSPAVTRETRFRYASITKLLTADAVVARINDGSLSLDSHLLEFVAVPKPLADERLADITIGQLLQHRAGFDRLKSIDPMTRHKVRPWCPYEMTRLAAQSLDFAPDERFAYSNLGYCLLGVVLERLSGKPLRELLDEEYDLAGRGIRFSDGPYMEDEVRYDFRNSSFYGEDYYRYFDFPALSSSAGLSGSAESLAVLMREMLARRPLNILSAPPKGDCDRHRDVRCFGFAVSAYQEPDDALILYAQDGFLFGSASKAVFDSQGGVTVWLGSGMAREPYLVSEKLISFLYQALGQVYSIK